MISWYKIPDTNIKIVLRKKSILNLDRFFSFYEVPMKSESIFLLFVINILLVLSSCNVNNDDTTSVTEKNDNSLFTLLPAQQTNINFQNTLTEGLNTNILMYEYFYNGGGVAAADFNDDGMTDLYFTANMSDNKLYINQGNMKFRDVTNISGAGGRPGPWKTGVNAVDINSDGKMDIYVCYSGNLPEDKRQNQLFINTGNSSDGVPHFTESAALYNLAATGYSNQSYFLDYDRDGDLDMLLLNHNPKNLPILNLEKTAQMFEGDNQEKGLRLLRQTNGKFLDVTREAKLNGSELSYGLGLGISDFNNDGWPDFYVSNDYSVPDFIYLNNGDGTFSNRLNEMIGHTSQFSMGNDVADINNDGLQDIYTLDMLPEDNRRQKLLLPADNFDKFDLNVKSGFYYQYMRNMLQINNGNGTFSEIGQSGQVSNSDWSWSALLADYNNDGRKDLYITNGYLRDYTNQDFIKYMNGYVQEKGKLVREDVMDIIKEMPSSNVINYIFENKGDQIFEHKNNEWGITQPSNSNGAAYADLDNDGDLDLIVNNINQPAFIYRNESNKTPDLHFLQIKLEGSFGNANGFGSRITLFANGLIQVQEQQPARGYLSSVSPILHFGLGSNKSIDSLTIRWPGGKMQTVSNILPDQQLTLFEKNSTHYFSKDQGQNTMFQQVKSPINFEDTDAIINDFNRQILLLCGQSFDGPYSAVSDLNGDGLQDVVIGGSAGQPASLFIQKEKNKFEKIMLPGFEEDKAYDDAGIEIFDANGDDKPDIYIGSGGYHQLKAEDPLLQDRLYINGGNGQFTRSNSLPAFFTSSSCVKANDINGDSYPDVFVGSKAIPGRYPESAGSKILLNDGKGHFTDATKNICPALENMGLVSDAAWLDVDGDNKNELIIAGEWMPVKVFTFQQGRLIDVSEKFLDKDYAGWWNTIETGDINSDGIPDLVIGNMGTNMQLQASEKEPVEMYFKDFDGNGTIDPILSSYIQHKRYPYITRDELINQLPGLRKKYPDYKSYAEATTDELFDKSDLDNAGHLRADFLKTVCFLNTRKGKLVPKELPEEAQYSPVYSIQIMDVNADGKNDLLLFGNSSHFKIRLGKFDANYGQYFAGDGQGNFKYIPQYQSGLNVWGDVRTSFMMHDQLYIGINGGKMISYKLNARSKN